MLMSQPKSFLIGAHVSIAGGFDQSIVRGDELSCTAIQIFTKSNRQWHAKPISDKEATLFKKTLTQASSVRNVIAHTAYLINLASANDAVREQSIQSLSMELIRCEQLGISSLVLHPGSGDTTNLKKTLLRVAQGLDTAFIQSNVQNVHILLETMAGQGNSIGHTFEQLAFIYANSTHQKNLGICIDTCHLFAAGYDIQSEHGYKKIWNQFDQILGLKQIKAIHLNDSKKPLGALIDRHEAIGKGIIGLDCFKRLVNDPRFFDIPKIIETPMESLKDHARNLHTLLQLLSPKTKKLYLQTKDQ